MISEKNELKNNERFLSYSGLLSFLFFLFFFFRIDSILLFRNDFNIYYFLSFLIFLFVFKARFNISNPIFIFIFIVFSWMLFVLVYDYFILEKIYDVKGKSQSFYRFNIFSNSIVFFVMGYVFFQLDVHFYFRKYRTSLFFLFFLTFSLFFMHFDGTEISYISISNSISTGWVNHLYFGSSVVLLSAILLSLFSGWARFSISIFVFFLLFFLGGGSAFVISIISFFMIYLLFLCKENIIFLIFSFFLFLLILLPVLYSVFQADASFLDRIYLFLEGGVYLNEQIFIGKPELILQYSNSYGSYLHNFLSMIQFFGLLPLIIIFILYFVFFYKALYLIKNYNDGVLFLFLFLLFYSFLSFFLSKFIAEWSIWFSIGLCSALIMSEKYR